MFYEIKGQAWLANEVFSGFFSSNNAWENTNVRDGGSKHSEHLH